MTAEHLHLAVGHASAPVAKAEPEAEWVDGVKGGLVRLAEAHKQASADLAGRGCSTGAFDEMYDDWAAKTSVARRH